MVETADPAPAQAAPVAPAPVLTVRPPGMMTSMSDQLGPEGELIDISQTEFDLYVVFNADETIAGITGRAAEPPQP
jgi:hypothetical protein